MKPAGATDLKSLEELDVWVGELRRSLRGDELLLLSGEMGAGKTELAKRLAREYGIRDISSPTFALHHQLQSELIRLDHLDLYRLESTDELETVGLWEILEDDSLVIVEWPERVPESYWPLKKKQIWIELQRSADSPSARHLSWRTVTPA